MGIDPSITGTGWAVLAFDCGKPWVRGMGVIRTRPDAKLGKWEDRQRRATLIGRELLQLMLAHDVSAVCVEAPIFTKHDGKASVHASARVRGMVEGLCVARGLRLSEVDPQAVKRAVCGRRDASKEEVARMLSRVYFARAQDIWAAGLDATDALAVAHVGGAVASEAVSGMVSYRQSVEADDELGF